MKYSMKIHIFSWTNPYQGRRPNWFVLRLYCYGIYQDAADSANSPNNGYHPGDFKFQDVNGDKEITAD